MKVTQTAIDGALLLEPTVFGDERGFFMESFNQRVFDESVGYAVRFVQDNHSRSQRGVLRGLHFQLPPHEQGKLVRVVRGEVFDVVVDIRRSSATFGRWIGIRIDDRNHRQLWVPPGLAHGFLVLSDSADFLYKTTDYYDPASERAIRWNDPQLAIDWPLAAIGQPTVSAKDSSAATLAEALA